MDKKIHELYILFLKQNARVTRFTEYNAYYEFEVEWEEIESRNIHCIHPELERWFRKKLFAMEKIRR